MSAQKMMSRTIEWAESILSTLGDEPPATKAGWSVRTSPARFVWLAGARAAAEHLCVELGQLAACDDAFAARVLMIRNAGMPIHDYMAFAERHASTCGQEGANFLRAVIADYGVEG